MDATILAAYNLIVENFTNVNYILKTDMDDDFDQDVVISKLLDLQVISAQSGPIPAIQFVAIAMRVLPSEYLKDVNPYEFLRREEIFSILKKYFNISDYDPCSVGSQMYHISVIKNLMLLPMVVHHRSRWGLDVILPLLSLTEFSIKYTIIGVDGRYDPERRNLEKVTTSYDNYVQLFATLAKQDPSKISIFYRMT